MKKILALLMGIALAVTCAAAFAEEVQTVQEAPDPDNYSGIWECDRATAEIIWEEEGYKVMIHWSSSAWETTTWEYACYYRKDDNTLLSTPFGIRTELVFDDNGEEKSVTVMYDDGVAGFSLDEEGYLIWQDEKEDAGKELRFEWVSEYNTELDSEEADG